MGFRTIVIKKRSKLDLKMNYLVCRNDEETRIYIPEISNLIIESTAVSLTCALISELVKNNVKIIFCDEKHSPESELVGYNINYNNSKKISWQIQWKEDIKGKVWQKIIQNKILKQKEFLQELNYPKEAELLQLYQEDVELNDITNREGHSAKVYFNALFGFDFSRRDSHFVNSALNYGYAIILACFNREIVSNGYITQLGIWHHNEFNHFNLSCDLMEPFRILVDKKVYFLEDGDLNYKMKILEILDEKVKIDGKEQYLENAISQYCNSIFESLNKEDINLLRFYE